MGHVVSSLDADTQRMIEDSLNRFVDDAYEPSARHARLLQPAIDYRAHWRALADLGVLGLSAGESLGGIGGSALDVSDALRALARGLVLEPVAESAVIAAAVLRLGAEPGAAADAVAQAIAGESLPILVGGRHGDALRCVASGAGWSVSGTARVVPGAGQADEWLVACTDEAGVARVLRMPARGAACHVHAYRMMDARQACDIVFDATPVASAAVWLEGAAAQAALQEASAQAVSAYCADAAGVMACLVRWTGDYLRTREQFGATLGTFQALQHRYADMHMAALESRAIAREIARAIDSEDAARIAWLRFAAPAVVTRCAAKVGHDAIQLHGGMGVTDELVISHGNSRLVVLSRLLARWAAQPVDVALATNPGPRGEHHV